MSKYHNFIKETCAGTGNVMTLLGAAEGFLPFSTASDEVAYVIVDADGQRKVTGTSTTFNASSLTRNDTWSYNGTTVDTDPASNITLSGGVHTIYCAESAEQLNELLSMLAGVVTGLGLKANAADLGTAAFMSAEDTISFSPLNVLPDSGRLGGKVNPFKLQLLTESFTMNQMMLPYNGGVWSEAGKFIHNNTTNGGTAGVLTEPVISLLAAMNRTLSSARYGVEFFVGKYTAGPGELYPVAGSDSVLRYLLTTGASSFQAFYGAKQAVTSSFWMRVTTGSVIFRYGELLVDGEPKPLLEPIIDDGWHLISLIDTNDRGYNTAFPGIYHELGTELEIALPVLSVGRVRHGFYASPMPTVNELIPS